MTYQWYKDGVAIPGAYSSTYTVLSVLGTSSGAYKVKVTNAGGSVMSAIAYLNILAPPSISTQPPSQSVVQGQNVSFSVVASGNPSPAYQWYFNGSSLGAAATGSTLSLTNVGTANAGNYRVLLANSQGSVTSAVATLTVNVPPAITTQPQSQTAAQGQDVSFSVAASGTAPLSYQWFFNASPVAAAGRGATGPTLALTNLTMNASGDYTVVVANAAGSVTSAVAVLTVVGPAFAPSLTGAAMTTNGFTFQLSLPAGHTYVVLASSDLGAWTPIATNVATSGSVVFTDPDTANYSSRFYRAWVQ